MTLEPKWLPGHLALANHYWSTGRSTEAEKALLQAIALEPANPVANRAIAVFYISINRAAEAEQYVVSACRSLGAEPFALADFYLFRNRPDAAIPQFHQLRSDRRVAEAAVIDWQRRRRSR